VTVAHALTEVNVDNATTGITLIGAADSDLGSVTRMPPTIRSASRRPPVRVAQRS
jgi:hypothetical protein